jgi:hypothetical protein
MVDGVLKVMEEHRGIARGAVAGEIAAVFTTLPADRYPNLVRFSDELVSGDGDERFHFGIDTFLDGLVARAARA